ncbi:septum formation initiator family protein [Bacillus cereus group sp. N21]|uniref:septum formation initiator family protein n=1 Tax=Bacillus cereus group sp. N21 TaxID=2794591 RepID=UPI0018F46D36|nr:septum formation initiator family protein [Bacillus cereus group sp. N21]MBJ8031947.1 septum formation initiator family protein [Bacillus cereus group sp. N21]
MGNIPKILSQQSNTKIPSQQVNPNTYQVNNKKIRRRVIFALAFMLPVIFFLQYSINKQQDIIKEKQIMIGKEKKELSSLKKDGQYFEKDLKILNGSEEDILKFARKLYKFSQSNEIIFETTE